MPRTPESTGGAAEAVDEAMRTISEASQHGTAYAQRALTTSRAYLSDAPKRFAAGATDIEAASKAAFGLQNAILAAVPPLMDATFGATKSVFAAYTTMVEHQQKIVLGAWKRVGEVTEEVAPLAK